MVRLPLGSLLIAASVAGCGGESDPAASAAGDVNQGAQTISFTVGFVDAVSKEPLADVTVCAAERDDVPCAISDADGVVTIDLPADSELMLACTHDTQVPTYMTLATGQADFDANVFMLLSKAFAPAFIKLGGGTEDPTKGILVANVYEDLVVRDKRVADAAYTLAPVAGIGPVYGAEGGLPDTTLTQTTMGGPAAIYDLDPGDATVTLSHPSRTCAGGFGWATESATALRTRVFAGGMSTVTFVCPP
jgi:hypothetical protein